MTGSMRWSVLALVGLHGVLAIAGMASVAAAQAPRETVISDAAAAEWFFDGNPRVRPVDAAELPGGKALLVTIPQKGANPWAMQARMKVQGVAAGDLVTFGFYARADRPDPGKETATVIARVQRGVAPYDAAVEGGIEIGREWRFHCLTGPARVTLPDAEAEVSVQLAGAKHAVAFGPWMATKAAGAGAKTGLPCGKAPGAT